jgi:low affinity Fe/Cu permease
MRAALLAITAAVVAAVIVWVITTETTPLPSSWQWIIIVGIGLIAMVGTYFLARNDQPGRSSGIRVGTNIRSKKDTKISDVEVTPADNSSVDIGRHIRSKASVMLSRIRIGNRNTLR